MEQAEIIDMLVRPGASFCHFKAGVYVLHPDHGVMALTRHTALCATKHEDSAWWEARPVKFEPAPTPPLENSRRCDQRALNDYFRSEIEKHLKLTNVTVQERADLCFATEVRWLGGNILVDEDAFRGKGSVEAMADMLIDLVKRAGA